MPGTDAPSDWASASGAVSGQEVEDLRRELDEVATRQSELMQRMTRISSEGYQRPAQQQPRAPQGVGGEEHGDVSARS